MDLLRALIGVGDAVRPICAPILFFLFSEKEKNRRSVRRSLLHSASAGAAKAPYSQPSSSFPKADRCAGSPFGSNKKRKETTREPFGWFSGLSIDQSLALDLRRRKVSVFTVSESNRIPAIIKIACGVVKFQMAKL